MRRIIIAGTIAFLIAIMTMTSMGQDGLLQAFVSNDLVFQGVRLGLIGLLITLLVTSPPRSLEFRSFLYMASAALTFSVVFMLSEYTMAVLDALLFVEVAIIFALEAIESPALAKGMAKKIPVKYDKQSMKIRI